MRPPEQLNAAKSREDVSHYDERNTRECELDLSYNQKSYKIANGGGFIEK